MKRVELEGQVRWHYIAGCIARMANGMRTVMKLSPFLTVIPTSIGNNYCGMVVVCFMFRVLQMGSEPSRNHLTYSTKWKGASLIGL